MKKWILSIVACATITLPAMAQQVEGNNQLLSSGDLYQGMSRSIPNGRVVLPYGLEVTFEKTVHLIFPAAIRYVDLGSQNIIAGKADDAENVLRVKAAVREFETETNMSVICEDGSFYAFNVKYADEPEKLSMEMKDFLAPTEGRLPSNRADIYFKELGSESPILVKLIMKSIYQNDKRTIKHVGASNSGCASYFVAYMPTMGCFTSTSVWIMSLICRMRWTSSRSRWWTRRWRSIQLYKSECYSHYVPFIR